MADPMRLDAPHEDSVGYVTANPVTMIKGSPIIDQEASDIALPETESDLEGAPAIWPSS